MRGHQILIRPDRYHLRRIDVVVRDVVVSLDMIEVHRLRDPVSLIQVLEISEKIRIVHDPPDVALEVTVIHRIEPDQRRKQTPVGLRNLISHQVARPGQTFFKLIQSLAHIPVEEMFEIFNMGVGFCVVVDEAAAEIVLEVLKRHNREAQIIGHAVADKEKRVRIPEYGLEGKGKIFRNKA